MKVAALAALLPLSAGAVAQVPSSATINTGTVAGLRAPAEILIDHWGIAHIYAASRHDAFLLQGYNAARDRLWQIDLWRKRGLGLLARDFGPAYVDQDRAARLFLYRGDMATEWAAYGPGARDAATAFIAGINAYVDGVRAGRLPLPREFTIAGTMPDRWSAADIVRIRSHGLTRNVSAEVRRAKTVCSAGLSADAMRSKLEPAWTTSIPVGLDPCSVPADVLRDYTLATRTVTFEPETFDAARSLAAADGDRDTIGSNNWVVAPSRSATGRAILANDPHRAHSAPSLRYIVHIEAPGLSVIGAGEPALPGISIGHNDRVAFGLTIFNADQEDLLFYDVDPADAGRYVYGSGTEAVRRVEERITVKGAADRRVTLEFTRHGPVLKRDGNRIWALRTAWLEPGTAAYFGSIDYMGARDWAGFSAALDRWRAPSENQVYADVDGNIGWIAAGLVPRRTSYDGLLPVPGDGRHEWQGFLPRSQLPSSYNPATGWIATANQMNLPSRYPIADRRIGFEWADPSRYTRIAEVLKANPKATLADMMALQNDPTSPLQRRLIALARGMTLPARSTAADRAALALVQQWDARVVPDSAAATVAEIWLGRHLGRTVVEALYGKTAAEGDVAAAGVLDALETPDARFGTAPAERRDALLRASLSAAVAEVVARLGPAPSGWRFGRLAQARFTHALAPIADPKLRDILSVGPFEVSGSPHSPKAVGFETDYTLRAGASFRMIVDVGNWDASRAINTPGQSGTPWSRHYGDLAAAWASGGYVPLLYSRAAVAKATDTRLVLTPVSAR